MAGRQDVALYRVLMNINQCGCRPYEWLGLDGDRCIRVIPRQFELLQMYLFYCVLLQLPVKQTPVILNRNSGAKQFNIYIMSDNCIYYIIHIFEKACKNVTCITGLIWAENRSDMDCE